MMVAQKAAQSLAAQRRQLGLLQREAAERLGVSTDTVVNWETGRTEPVPAQFRPLVAFLGYDPTPEPKNLSERLAAKQRRLGASLAQVARYLGWDPGSLRRYLDGTWHISLDRRDALEEFLDAEDEALAGVHSLKRRR